MSVPLSCACVHVESSQLVTNDCRFSIELTLSGVPVESCEVMCVRVHVCMLLVAVTCTCTCTCSYTEITQLHFSMFSLCRVS